MNLKELRERLAKLYAEARALADRNEKEGLNEADEKRFQDLMREIREVKPLLEAAEVREAELIEVRNGDRLFNHATGSVAAGATLEARAAAAAAGQPLAQYVQEQRSKRLSDIFLESEEFRAASASRWSKGIKTDPVGVGSFFFREGRAAMDVTGMGPEELRTLIYTGAQPSNPALVAPYRVPGIYSPDATETNVRSAFLNLQTSSPVIQFFRELLFTNNADFVAEATATSGASGTKPESALTFEAASVVAEVLAHWIPATNQMLEDLPQMRGVIEGRLLDGLRLKEDDALLNGTGVSPEIDGLLGATGVQVADSTYFSGAAVQNAGDDWEDFDRITRARRLVRQVGRARPSFVMMSPADLERLLTVTDTDGQYYSGSPFGDLALARMRGLQVIETEALDDGTFVVGDGRMAAVFDRMEAAITAGWIDQQFVRNMITILAEERLAFAVFRPQAFVIGDFAS